MDPSAGLNALERKKFLLLPVIDSRLTGPPVSTISSVLTTPPDLSVRFTLLLIFILQLFQFCVAL